MEKIRVIWAYTSDILCVPELISQNLYEYTSDFLEWVEGTSFDDEIQDATCFASEHFVQYLNDRYLSESWEKAYVMYENYSPKTERERREWKKMRKIYF
ncbi:MAG: hypothetical protein LUE23_09495 [Lachnospiraceae bacterium]|nr:hypothetical protein [Lachnospiraceae bacterium]